MVIFLFRSLLNSRKVLNRWADLFERNSIIAGLNISMNKLNKEEALMAVAETIEEIGEPLQRFFFGYTRLEQVHRRCEREEKCL